MARLVTKATSGTTGAGSGPGAGPGPGPGPGAAAPEVLLGVEAATVRFGDRPVLDAVDLEVAEHEIVCVLGPSGSGKSTLLRAVAGLQPLDAGRVLLTGHDQAGCPRTAGASG